jgi:hypothetical protein
MNKEDLEITREIFRRTREKLRRQHSGKRSFSIINIFKRYKITDLTRPNELGTTTNKVATRSPERTRL